MMKSGEWELGLSERVFLLSLSSSGKIEKLSGKMKNFRDDISGRSLKEKLEMGLGRGVK